MSNIARLIGENISKIRLAKGWSQKQLGEKADVTTKTINVYENGSAGIKLDTLKVIADALGVSDADLVMGTQTDLMLKIAQLTMEIDRLKALLAEQAKVPASASVSDRQKTDKLASEAREALRKAPKKIVKS